MIASTAGLKEETDQDFDNLKVRESDFTQNYQFDRGLICRRLALTHTFQTLKGARDRLKEIQRVKQEQDRQEEFLLDDVPNIRFQDNAINLTKQANQYFQATLQENQATQLTKGLIFKAIAKQHKWNVLFIFFFYAVEAACRLVFSILLQMLFQIIRDLRGAQNIRNAYLLSFFTGFIWFIGQVFRHNAFYEVPILVNKIRSSLMLLLFKKLTKISQYVAKTQELGKVINMLSNDFNLIQLKSPVFFAGMITPFVLIGVIAILVTRFGWPGIISPIVTLILIPLQLFVGKINGSLLVEVNVYKDQRIKICTEIIEGIKFIKLYGWEIAFKNIIQLLRKQQITNYIKLSFGRSVERSLANSTALWSGLVTFSVIYFTGEGQTLTTANIFSTLEILVTLRLSLFFFGIGGGFLFELLVILERFANILNINEEKMLKIDEETKKPINQNRHEEGELHFMQGSLSHIKQSSSPKKLPPVKRKGEIKFTNFNGYWGEQLETPTLKNINIHIKKGQFCGITGKIGSGKSGLLGVLIDQIPFYSGQVLKEGSIAYVEQEPIIFSATIRQNILFGAQFKQQTYQNALKDSCLTADLELFEEGEDTVVGERGITLSGGQKARLALARALYVDADIYLFDDPLSAVDSKVAKQINENVMLKMRNKKTIILVTHQISYLYQCDRVIIMEDGEVVHNDDPNKIVEELKKIQISEHEKKMNEEEEQDEEQKRIREELKNEERMLKVEIMRKRKSSIVSGKSDKETVHKISSTKKEESVDVTCASYTNYIFFSKINYFLFTIAIIFFLICQAIVTLYFRFLAGFDDLVQGKNETFQGNDQLYFGMLGLMLFCYTLFSIIKYTIVNLYVLQSNKDIHQAMIHGLVRSPSSYFDLTPTGQITNKFSNDLGILDNTLAFTLIDVIEGPIVSIIMMVNIFTIDTFFLIPGCINILFLIVYFMFCKAAIVQVKQLDLKKKSPVFSMVNEIISGLIQIRIFQRRPSLLKEFSSLIDNSFRAGISFWNCSRAFGGYIAYFSLTVMTIGFVIGVNNIETYEGEQSNSSLAGLYGVSVVFLIQINDYLQWFLRQIINMESIMVSVQRSFIVKDLQPQKQLVNEYDQSLGIQALENEDSASDEWPSHATIKINNFSMKYRPQLPLVLKNISFDIEAGEKVGIVGRTGAGKSSIVQALFRIVEPEEGSIYRVDNADALKLGLHTLRQRISVIPQTPFLFKGSIKTNLDPFEKKSQEELWNVLEESGLKDAVEKMPDKLQTNISNVSQVFSVGQKQLLCLARALIKKNKFLFLDEATSNVDMQTDNFIQNCIHTKFKDTTVITIAHRLNTIADYDKVIVMDRGRVIEIGNPHELIEKNGLFSEMVNHTGKNAQLIKKIAKTSYEKYQK